MGGEGGGDGGGDTLVEMATLLTATPSSDVACAGVPRLLATAAWMAAALVDGGTKTVKTSSTLAEVTVARTRPATTPALAATSAASASSMEAS